MNPSTHKGENGINMKWYIMIWRHKKLQGWSDWASWKFLSSHLKLDLTCKIRHRWRLRDMQTPHHSRQATTVIGTNQDKTQQDNDGRRLLKHVTQQPLYLVMLFHEQLLKQQQQWWWWWRRQPFVTSSHTSQWYSDA